MFETDNNQDYIDSRDIITRFDELKERDDYWEQGEAEREDDDTVVFSDGPLDDDEVDELQQLRRVMDQGETLPDWIHGVTLVRDNYFTDYAKSLAYDLGYLEGNENDYNPLYYCIDWEKWAESVQGDYIDIDYDGVTYWAR